MTHRRACVRCAIAAIAVAVPMAATALNPASAATTLTRTEIAGFSVTPNPITYANRDVTVSGDLVEYASTSTGVSGETIDVYENGTTAATVTTGSDGTFSTTVDLTDAGTVEAVFYTDRTTGYGGAAAETTVTATELPATVTLAKPAASQVWAGTTVDFTGKAAVTGTDGTIEPVDGGVVALTGLGQETTASDGTFAFTTRAEGGLLAERAELLPNSDIAGDAFWTATDSTSVGVTTRFRTRITLFHVASQMEAHHYYHVAGTVQRWTGSAWVAAPGLSVNIQYIYNGWKYWHSNGSPATDASGDFDMAFLMKPGTVHWRVWTSYQSIGDNYTASNSEAQTTTVKDRTCTQLNSGNYTEGRTVLGSRVIDWCGSPSITYGSITGKAVQLYYRPADSGTWRYLGWARTGTGGNFTYTHNGILKGYFKAVFPAQGYYLGSTSGDRTLK